MKAEQTVEFYQTIPQRFFFNGQEHQVWGIISHSKEYNSGSQVQSYVVMTPNMETFKIWFDIRSDSWLVEESP